MLFGWMKSLIIYLILSGLIVNLAPDNNYKRYINFFTGLIVIIILAEPIAYVFRLGNGDLDEITSGIESYMSQSEVIYDRDNIYDYYKMSVGESVRQYMAELGYNTDSVEIITDDNKNILKCTLVICDREDLSKDDAVDIKKDISDVYNVDFDSIYIVRR